MELNVTANESRRELKEKLKSLGVAQARLAEACDCSQTAITFWFRGSLQSPTLDRAIPAFIRGVETETKPQKGSGLKCANH